MSPALACFGRRAFNQRVGLLAGVMTARCGTLLRLFAAAERPGVLSWQFAREPAEPRFSARDPSPPPVRAA